MTFFSPSPANGVDEGHINIPSPQAPSFIAVDKKTGKLLWENSLPGEKILHGQWSNASYGVIKGRPQVIFAGGNGWLYSFEPKTGKLLWSFDCNPKDALWKIGGAGTRNYIISTPVIWDDKVYIGVGQDPGARRSERPSLGGGRHDGGGRHGQGCRLAPRRRGVPPHALDRRDRRRGHPLHVRPLGPPVRPGRQDRAALLEARRLRGHLGLAVRGRRQGLSGRRGWRHAWC